MFIDQPGDEQTQNNNQQSFREQVEPRKETGDNSNTEEPVTGAEHGAQPPNAADSALRWLKNNAIDPLVQRIT